MNRGRLMSSVAHAKAVSNCSVTIASAYGRALGFNRHSNRYGSSIEHRASCHYSHILPVMHGVCTFMLARHCFLTSGPIQRSQGATALPRGGPVTFPLLVVVFLAFDQLSGMELVTYRFFSEAYDLIGVHLRPN